MGLSDFQKKVFEMSSVTKGHSGFAAKSSIRYVERSFELAGTMQGKIMNMPMFKGFMA